jgi:putative ABC transport system ATP-binding protein
MSTPAIKTQTINNRSTPPLSNTPALRAESLTLTFVTPRSVTHAVREVSLEVGARDFAGIVGPSGSGKTSLLYLLSGLRTATSGKVFLDDWEYSAASSREKLQARRDRLGFVFQQPFLIPYLHILENVLVPIENPQPADISRAMELLDALGIAELARKFPNECSGGERVRAATARGLVHRPALLFVDEPTASLDLATSQRVMEVLTSQREHGALLVVTHDLEILHNAAVVFRMRDGELTETTRVEGRDLNEQVL